MAELVFNIDNTALETVKALQIGANFDEMENALKEIVAPYKNMVVSEDGVAQAKTDRARINKVSKSIDDRRKLVKKLYSAPLTEFEDKCKRLTNICAEAAGNLDEQVKEYENQMKAQKIESLRQFFDSQTKRHPEFMDFSECENPRWSNFGYAIEDAQREIENYVQKVDTDIDAIKALDSKYELMMLDEYRKTGDVSAALVLKSRLEASEREAEERRIRAAQLEEQKKLAAEQRKCAETLREDAKEKVSSAAIVPEDIPAEPIVEEYIPVIIGVACKSRADENALRAFCHNHGLRIME